MTVLTRRRRRRPRRRLGAPSRRAGSRALVSPAADHGAQTRACPRVAAAAASILGSSASRHLRRSAVRTRLCDGHGFLIDSRSPTRRATAAPGRCGSPRSGPARSERGSPSAGKERKDITGVLLSGGPRRGSSRSKWTKSSFVEEPLCRPGVSYHRRPGHDDARRAATTAARCSMCRLHLRSKGASIAPARTAARATTRSTPGPAAPPVAPREWPAPASAPSASAVGRWIAFATILPMVFVVGLVIA